MEEVRRYRVLKISTVVSKTRWHCVASIEYPATLASTQAVKRDSLNSASLKLRFRPHADALRYYPRPYPGTLPRRHRHQPALLIGTSVAARQPVAETLVQRVPAAATGLFQATAAAPQHHHQVHSLDCRRALFTGKMTFRSSYRDSSGRQRSHADGHRAHRYDYSKTTHCTTVPSLGGVDIRQIMYHIVAMRVAAHVYLEYKNAIPARTPDFSWMSSQQYFIYSTTPQVVKGGRNV